MRLAMACLLIQQSEQLKIMMVTGLLSVSPDHAWQFARGWSAWFEPI